MTDFASIGIKIDTTDVKRASSDLESIKTSGDRAEQSASGLTSTYKAMGAAVAALGLAKLAQEAVQLADSYTKLTAQMRIATDSATSYAKAMEDVKRISTSSQASLEATGQLYGKLNMALKESGASQATVARITETVSLGLKVNGASAAETASAMLQLSQAFGSGKLQGQEFAAMAESAPNLLRTLAASMGVTYGELKNMSAAGTITSDVMAKAFSDPKILDGLREQGKTMQTVGGAMQVLENQVMLSVGSFMQQSGAVGLAASAIGLLSGAAAALGNHMEGVIAVAKGLAAAVAGMAIASLTSAIVTAVAAFGGLTGAIGAATVAMKAFMLSNPIGLITLALGAGVAAWSLWGNAAENAAQKAIKAAQGSELAMKATGIAQIEIINAQLRADIRRAEATGGATRSLSLEVMKNNDQIAELRKADLKSAEEHDLKTTASWRAATDTQAQLRSADLKSLYTQYTEQFKSQKMSDANRMELTTQYHEGVRQINEKYADKGAAKVASKAAKEAADAIKQAQADALKANEDFVNSQIKAATTTDTETASIIKKTESIRFETESIGKTKEQIVLMQAARFDNETAIISGTLATLDAAKACTAESEALRANIKARQDQKAALNTQGAAIATQAAVDLEKKSNKDMWKTIEQTAHSTWTNVFQGGQDAFTKIGATIKASILDMLWQITVKQWFIGITASITSGGASSATQAAGAASGGGSGVGSWISAGKSIYDGITGGFTALSTTIAQGAAHLGVALGGAETTVGNALLSNAGAIGTVGSYLGAGMAGITLGSMIGGDKKVLGMDSTTTAAIGTAIGMAVAGPLGAVIGGVAGGVFSAAFGKGPKVAGTTTLAGQFSGEGFAGQYQTPWSQKGGWFSSGSSGVDAQGVGGEQQAALSAVVGGSKSVFDALVTTTGDATKSLAGWSFAINRQVATQEQQTALVNDMANSMGAFLIPQLAALKKAGETLADTAVRMRDEFILTSTIAKLTGASFKALGVDSLAVRDNLVNLMGGLQTMGATVQTYYANFFTASERHANDLGALTLQFAALGFAVPQTARGFRDLVGAQDLSTAAGQQAFAALMGLSGAFGQLVQTADAATASVQANVDALKSAAKASYDAAIAGVNAQRAFALSVKDLIASISGKTATGADFATINKAAAGGDVSAQGQLAGAANAFLSNAKTQAGSAADYARSLAFVQNALSDTASKTTTAVAIADKQLAAILESNILLGAIDSKNGVQNNTLDFLLTASIASTEAARAAVVTQSIGKAIDAIGAAVTAAGGSFNSSGVTQSVNAATGATSLGYTSGYNTMAATVGSTGATSAVSTTVDTVAKATSDAAAKAVLDAAAAKASRVQAKADALAQYQYYADVRNSVALMTSVYGYNPSMGYIGSPVIVKADKNIADAKAAYDALPSFAVGADSLPSDMIAQVHAGERIIPAADNKQLMQRLSTPDGNSEIVAELRAVRSQLAQVQSELSDIKRTNREMNRTMDKFDIDGLPATRV